MPLYFRNIAQLFSSLLSKSKWVNILRILQCPYRCPYLLYKSSFAPKYSLFLLGQDVLSFGPNSMLRLFDTESLAVTGCFFSVHRVCRSHINPAPKASEIMISIMAMVTCKNLKVTFFKSLLPMYAPAIAARVAHTTKIKLSLSPVLLNRVA